MNAEVSSPQPARRAGKSAAAFRTISEVAAELDVPSHVLRFWETKFNQVRPLKRGGGRRYYRPEDVDLLRRIRALLYDDGYTIKGVQKLLRENGVKAPARSAPKPAARTAAGAGNGLNADQRQQLRDVLVELESLRDILRDS
mgnify:CR=1 FL=1